MKVLLAALALGATSPSDGATTSPLVPTADPPGTTLLTQPPSSAWEAPAERPRTTLGRDLGPALGSGASPGAAGVDARLPEIPSEYRIDARAGVRVAFHPTLLDAADRVFRQLEAARGRLSARVGQRVLERVEVRLVRTPDELVALTPRTAPPAPGEDLAVFVGAHVIAISAQPGLSGDDFEARVRHAAAHVALFDAVDGRPLPRWLDEGFAIESADDGRTARALTLARAQLDGSTMTLAQLEAFPDDAASMALAEAEVADLVRTLSHDGGAGRFTALLGRLRAGEPFAQALTVTYEADLPTLEARWREQLARRYLQRPLAIGGGSLALLAAGVLIARGVRRRRREAALARAEQQTAEALAALIPDAPRGRPPRLIVVDQGRGHVVYHVSSRPVPKVVHEGKQHTLH
jgi:hypothetical protein